MAPKKPLAYKKDGGDRSKDGYIGRHRRQPGNTKGLSAEAKAQRKQDQN